MEQRRTMLLCGLTVLVAVLLGCSSEQAAHASVTVRGVATQALSSADVISVNGTYGAGCTSRSGAWSIPVGSPSLLDPPRLSVLMNDSGCVLTLTGIRTSGGLIAAMPAIVLTTSYAVSPSAFAMPVAFYANAKLSATSFSSDFQLTLLYASNLAAGTADHFAEAIPPKVIGETPAPLAMGRSINTRPTAKFDTEMDPTSLSNATFTLQQGQTTVPGTVTFDAPTNTATFKPSAPLELGTLYTATITVGARDVGNTPLASNHVWSFTTALSSQASVALQTASTYAVLAADAVTNTGATSITGDLGTNTSLTGFPPGTIVGGAAYVTGPTAAKAISDLTSAYNDASGRALDPVVVSGNIGGSTRMPGLYRAATSLEVSTGELTLDANDDVDAVFIFQIGTTFTMGTGRQILLVNGAQAANVFWQVGSSATLGTGSILHGTIMADQSITMNTNATVNGRVLARGAAVTMDTNTVVRPPL